MKTKMLKTVMPILAFVMAIGLAFATETTDNGQTGYYLNPTTHQVEKITVDCDSSSSMICTYNDQPVFADEERQILLHKTANH